MKRLLLLSGLLILSTFAMAQNVLQIGSPFEEHTDLSDYIYVFNDTASNTEVEQLLTAAPSDFTPLNKISDFSATGTYWGKLHVTSQLKLDKSYFFHWFSVSPMRLNLMDAYIVENGELRNKKEFGFTRPKSTLVGTNEWDRFEFVLKKKAEYIFYFKIQNSYGFKPTFDIRIVEPQAQVKRESHRNLIYLFYEGMLWIMILYNLLVSFHNRDKAYLYYALYMLSTATYTLYFQQFILSSVLTETPHLNAYFWLLSLGLGPTFYWQFFRHSLNIKKILPKIWEKIITVAIFSKIALVVGEVISYTLLDNVQQLTTLVSVGIFVEMLFNITLLIRLLRTRVKTVYFLLIGSLGLWIGFTTANVQYMMGNYDAQIWGAVGVIFEVLMFSLGLGYRMQLTEKQKRQAQEGLIEQLRKNEELQAQANSELEIKVRERTAEIMAQQEEIQAQNDKLTETFDKLNHTYRQIKDSITYARRIQNAVLPQREEFSELLKQYFIYYKPRDIVSGDFYWVKRIRNQLLVAAVDCTGHGVPGAFLSLLGIAFLNEISSNLLSSNTEFKANDILEQLRCKVKESLKQHSRSGNTAAKEAMDVAMCIIDRDNMQMQFAGAHNPLYMIRDGIFKEYKGDRMPISSHKKERAFTNHIINLQPNDIFYIFSDGILDQFGGQHGDKMKPKRFKQTLSTFKNIPLSKQQILLDQAFNDWKNSYPQLDDILVLGFKV